MRQRKSRGVRACRKKLDAALAASELNKKTQIALAEAIADAEDLDSIPKDLVSKLFRQLPVDPQTIERAARVLGVSAQSLYLDAQSAAQPVPESSAQSSRLAVRGQLGVWLVGVIGLLLAGWGIYAVLQPDTEQQDSCFTVPGASLSTEPDELGVVIAPFKGDPQDELQMLLARAFSTDTKLNSAVRILTHCEPVLIAAGDYRQQLRNAHKNAASVLQRHDAQLVIWGERYGNKVTLRFTHERPVMNAVEMKIADKTVTTNAVDFSFNIDLNSDQPLPADLKLIALAMMQPRSDLREEVRNTLLSRYQYSGQWLEQAVLSDKQLLRTMSWQDNPRLYLMTASQLCYRYRLLGDMLTSKAHYLSAQESCSEALEVAQRMGTDGTRASLLGNLGTVFVRLYRFESTLSNRRERLEQGLDKLVQAEQLYGQQVHPQDLAVLLQNQAAAWIRMAEIDPDQSEVWLEKAAELSARSLAVTKPDDNPANYAMRLQNQCVLQFRLGSMRQAIPLIVAAQQDCQRAQALVHQQRNPRLWAKIQNNLAVSYAIQAELEASDRIFSQALDAFDIAQQVYTRQDYAPNWAEVEINKAELYCKLALLKGSEAELLSSREHAESALLVFQQKGVKHYAAYAEQLLQHLQNCDKTAIKQCRCSS